MEILSSNGSTLDLFGITTSDLSVLGRDQFGQEIAFTETVQWSTDNDNISINQNGRVGNKPILWNYFDDPKRKNIYNTWNKLIQLKLVNNFDITFICKLLETI